MKHRRITGLLVCALVVTIGPPGSPGVPLADLDRRQEPLQIEGQPTVSLRFRTRPEAAGEVQRIVDTTQSTLRRLTEWYGPFSHAELSVFDTRWDSPMARGWLAGSAAYSGAVVSARWLTWPRDHSLERAVVDSITRQYWQNVALDSASQPWLARGLALYSATRAIHEELEGRNYATERYFGGFVPYTIRAVLLSPPLEDPRPRVRTFAELAMRERPEVSRIALAFHTLERYLGWPAVQQLLAAWVQRFRTKHPTPEDLSAAVRELRGRDLDWFFTPAFNVAARFDYGIDRLVSEPSASDASRFETTVTVRRYGDAIFAGTSAPKTSEFPEARSLPVLVTFADGTEVRDWCDGRESQVDLKYLSASRAVSASVDPDAMLLLDADRANNSRTLQPRFHPAGSRVLVHWLVWLQDLMLTQTALL